MSQSYPFTISTAFPNAKVSVPVLQDQIRVSDIGNTYERTVCASDTCTITFSTALSSPGVAILDALVAAHQGIPYSAFPVTATDTPTEQASSIEPLDKVAVEVNLPPGEYDIEWSCDLMSSSTSKEIFINIKVNGDVIRQSKEAARIDGWVPLYGIAPMTITQAGAGVQTVRLQYGCTVEGMSAHIRDGMLKIEERQ